MKNVVIIVIVADGDQRVVSLRQDGNAFVGHRLDDHVSEVVIPAEMTMSDALRVVINDEADAA